MPLIAMDASFPLLQFDRVGGQIPVVNDMTIGMEVETFLTDGCRREDKRPERGVESRLDSLRSGEFLVLVAPEVTEAHGKAAAEIERVERKRPSPRSNLELVKLDSRRMNGDCFLHGLPDLL